MTHWTVLRWALAALAGSLLIMAAPDRTAHAAEKRLALVIGNEAYPAQPGRLSLPHEDAEAVAGALRQVGFQVTLERDLGRAAFGAALSRFEQALAREAASGADVTAFFYFSGHGASALSGGRRVNMLIPSDATVATQGDLLREGIGLDAVIDGLAAAGAASSFVVVDACRTELNAAFTKGPDKGFGVVAARNGLIVAQATFPGETAPDDGVFAQALARHLVTPGQYASRVFELAYRDVQATRPSYQLPTVAGALTRDFCFNGCPGGAPIVAPVVAPGAAPAQSPRVVAAPAARPAPSYPIAVELAFGKGMDAFEAKNWSQAVRSLTEACDKDHAAACERLGFLHSRGWGLWSSSDEKAATLYRKACDLGEGDGCASLAFMHRLGDGFAKDLERAVALYQEACSMGSLEGCHNVGDAAYHGWGGLDDDALGLQLWEEACAGNHAESCESLGYVYDSREPARALPYFQKACSLGWSLGCSSAERMRKRL